MQSTFFAQKKKPSMSLAMHKARVKKPDTEEQRARRKQRDAARWESKRASVLASSAEHRAVSAVAAQQALAPLLAMQAWQNTQASSRPLFVLPTTVHAAASLAASAAHRAHAAASADASHTAWSPVPAVGASRAAIRTDERSRKLAQLQLHYTALLSSPITPASHVDPRAIAAPIAAPSASLSPAAHAAWLPASPPPPRSSIAASTSASPPPPPASLATARSLPIVAGTVTGRTLDRSQALALARLQQQPSASTKQQAHHRAATVTPPSHASSARAHSHRPLLDVSDVRRNGVAAESLLVAEAPFVAGSTISLAIAPSARRDRAPRPVPPTQLQQVGHTIARMHRTCSTAGRSPGCALRLTSLFVVVCCSCTCCA